MKQDEILKIVAQVVGASSPELAEVNKALKGKAALATKFKIHGEKFGYIGLTVAIKGLTPEGLKIFDVNKVRLIRFSEIKSFEKAKPMVPRPVYPKKPVDAVAAKGLVKPRKNLFALTERDKELESEVQAEEAKVTKPPKRRPKSNFIPAKKSR